MTMAGREVRYSCSSPREIKRIDAPSARTLIANQPTKHSMDTSQFTRFARVFPTLAGNTSRHPELLLGEDSGCELYYIPFEEVNAHARLVLVGITPGESQMKIANAVARRELANNTPREEILRLAKVEGAFGGKQFRENLCGMLDHFRVPDWLGIESSASLFEADSQLLYSTSIVPFAAFVRGKGLNGPFKIVESTPLFFECFRDCFATRVATLSAETRFIALGPVPLDGLEWCVRNGFLRKEQIIGSVAHPSPEAGSQVDVFLGRLKITDLKPTNPVRHRMPLFRRQYDSMVMGMSHLLGRRLPSATETYGENQ